MKTVIITGTSSGIGLELVKIFDSKGFNVISLSRNNLPNSSKFSENVNHIKFDITKDSNIKSLVDTIKTKYKEIHILINNAGRLINKSFENFTDSEFRSVYDVNFFGVVNLIKSLICGISPIVCLSINQCCDESLLISLLDFLGNTIFKCFFTRLL